MFKVNVIEIVWNIIEDVLCKNLVFRFVVVWEEFLGSSKFELLEIDFFGELFVKWVVF